jgi:phosphatidylglycerophosphatase A
VLGRVATFVATAAYVGFVPIAPGTFGSAVGLAIYAAVRSTGGPALEAVVIACAFIAGVWSAGHVEREMGKDPGAVVIDEVLGMLATVAFLDVTMLGAVIGFFVFRALDVIKPFPAGRLEHLHGGPGVMLDDLMAGVYSNLVLRALIWAFPGVLA